MEILTLKARWCWRSNRVTARFTATRVSRRRLCACDQRSHHFDRSLQPYQITELVRGFVDNVRGPAAFSANITGHATRSPARGLVHLDGVSLATSTIRSSRRARDIAFDDSSI